MAENNYKHKDLPPRNHPDYLKLYREKHKDELKKKRKKWAKKKLKEDPDFFKLSPEQRKEQRERNIKWHLEYTWKRQGIIDFTYEQYLIEVEKSKGLCSICSEKMNKIQVDHCHVTGKYRGLLCTSCNMGLGVYEKKKTLFEEYLNR